MSRNAELRVLPLFGRGPLGVRFSTLLCLLAGLAAIGSSAAKAQGFIPRETGPAPKVEVFAGYSYLYPHTTATGYLPNGIAPVSTCLCSIPDGGGGSITYDFTPWLGLTVDGGVHRGAKGGTPGQTIGTANDSNVFVGPQIKLRHHHFAPFAELLVGEDTLSPSVFPSNTAFGLLAGGGLDVGLGKHFGIRVFQADVLYSPHSFGAGASTEVGLRVQGGVVFSFGGAKPAAAVMAPAAAMPVAAAPAIVAAVPAPVDVLTLTAQASPASIMAGESSTIMGNGVSSLGRPLTYSYSSTIGAISGTGATAILRTAGAGAGTAMVTVSVFDDMNQTAVATVPVVLEKPEVAAVMPVASSSLCSMSFARDRRRPARVDNEAKACLDGIALTLEHNTDAQLVLVGSASARERHHRRLAARRARNVKAYLVEEKGIDASRVKLYTGSGGDKAVSSTLVPAGATVDTSGMTPVVLQ
jgi:hypothetical protein